MTNGQQSGSGLLHHHRRIAALTQEQLAERTGLSVRTIRNLERGRITSPRAQSVRLLADALGLSDADRALLRGPVRRDREGPPGHLQLAAAGPEDGRLTDAQGRMVDFKNTVIIMTTNLGTRDISKGVSVGFARQGEARGSYDRMKGKVG